MTRRVLFISLAVILTILEVALKAIIDSLLGWKSGGGAIPMVLFVGLLILTWKACLKWGENKKEIRIQEIPKESFQPTTPLVKPTTLYLKKFIAKETLIALSLILIGVLLVFFFEYQSSLWKLNTIENYNNEKWYRNLFHLRIGYLNEPEGEIDTFDEFNHKLWRLFYLHDKPYIDKQELLNQTFSYSYFSILILLYPVRVLYYLIKWCMRTLRS